MSVARICVATFMPLNILSLAIGIQDLAQYHIRAVFPLPLPHIPPGSLAVAIITPIGRRGEGFELRSDRASRVLQNMYSL